MKRFKDKIKILIDRIIIKIYWLVDGKYNRPFTMNDGIAIKEAYFGQFVTNHAEGNNIIKDLFKREKSFLVSRFGATELEYIYYYLSYVKTKKKSWTQYHRENIITQSGVYPTTDKLLNEFCEIYIKSIKSIDVLGVWFKPGEDYFYKRYCPKSYLVPLISLEPYFHTDPWTQKLEGKKILIIHPFARSIDNQIKKLTKLFPNENFYPNCQFSTYKAVQSLNASSSEFDNWVGALNFMKKEIINFKFDIAIIGAGAYGLPLAAFIKTKLKRSVIHLGGATQLLFGIKGNRWLNDVRINKFFNENWIFPLEEEKPKGELLENECYW